MDKDIVRLHEIRNGGCCCAETIVKLALELDGACDAGFARASRGLCGGMRSGYTCGALTGAALMLSYFDKEQRETDMLKELTEWFESEYGEKYGSSDCRDITACDPMQKRGRCDAIIEKTYEEAREILLDHGFDILNMNNGGSSAD